MYFNYHAKLRRLISEGEIVSFQFVESHNKISPCLLIFSKDGRVYPIREHKFAEYYDLLLSNGVEEKRAGD